MAQTVPFFFHTKILYYLRKRLSTIFSCFYQAIFPVYQVPPGYFCYRQMGAADGTYQRTFFIGCSLNISEIKKEKLLYGRNFPFFFKKSPRMLSGQLLTFIFFLNIFLLVRRRSRNAGPGPPFLLPGLFQSKRYIFPNGNGAVLRHVSCPQGFWNESL